jgi:hypothetical protein
MTKQLLDSALPNPNHDFAQQMRDHFLASDA